MLFCPLRTTEIFVLQMVDKESKRGISCQQLKTFEKNGRGHSYLVSNVVKELFVPFLHDH